MENHPIPQDVTGFKFRLIGSVTLKQFLYLLGAGVVCLILYILPIPVFVKIPLMIVPVAISLCLAFVPIDGRPMDKMIMNFAKALPSENEYIYKKTGVDMPFFAFNAPMKAHTTQLSDQRTTQKTELFNQLSRSYFNPDKDEVEGIASISSLFQEGAVTAQGFTNRVVKADEMPHVDAAAPAPLPTSETPNKETENVLSKPFVKPVEPEDLSKPVELPVMPVEQAAPKTAEPVAPIAQPAVTQPIATVQSAPVVTPTVTPVAAAPQASYESPNVIEGIVKDPRGKPLPHIIVEVINNATSIPVRTFRTAANGMFVSATAIPNGEYTLHMEDTLKKQDFTDKEIKVDGSVLPVIEITSTDQREKLRRELFGQTA